MSAYARLVGRALAAVLILSLLGVLFVLSTMPTSTTPHAAVQRGATAPVGLLNLLDPELFPYTVVNGSTFPGPDEQVKAATPSVSSPNYNDAILQFVRDTFPMTGTSRASHCSQSICAG